MDRRAAMQARSRARVGSDAAPQHAENDIRFWIFPIALLGIMAAGIYFSYAVWSKALS
jgi:hypothetical protein